MNKKNYFSKYKILLFLFILVKLSLAGFIFATELINPLDVVISEIAWMGTNNSNFDEWIELYNNTDKNINLEAWGLYEANGETLIEPLTGIINAKSYYLIERTDDETVPHIIADQKPSSWGGHGLNNSGEILWLLNNTSLVVDEIDCSNGWFAGIANDDYKTMERKNTTLIGNNEKNWQSSQNSLGTPKNKNKIYDEDIDELDPIQKPEIKINGDEPEPEPKPIIYPTGVVINEILPSPKGSDSENEYIEIFNQNNKKIDVSGWKIFDTVGSIKTYIFPDTTIIKPFGFLLLPCATTKITLNNSSDGLQLAHPDGKIIDSMLYNEKAPQNQSYNRDGSMWIWSNVLTPNSKNIISNKNLDIEKNNTKENNKSISTFSSGANKQKSQTIKQSASISEIIQLNKNKPLSKFILVFLGALSIAILSATTILFLKN